jgi:hypothetical protein
MKKTIFICFLSVFISFCENKNEIKLLQAETEKVHDDAMREMAEMNRIARNLKTHPVLKAEITIENGRKDSILAVLHQIEVAEADMMSWMTSYVEPDEKMEKNAAIAYLNDQKNKMVKNQKDIHEAVLAGKVFLVK